MKIKKSKYLFFYFRKFPKFDIENLLNNDYQIKEDKMVDQIIALPILYGEEIIINKDEFELLKTLDQNNWTDYNDSLNHIKNLLDHGIIITTEDSEWSIYKEKEDILESSQWNIYSSLFHFMTRWKDIDVALKNENEGKSNISADLITDMSNKYGLPPSHFHKIKSNNTEKNVNLLKPLFKNSEFIDVLLKRKTSRIFDVNSQISLKDFSSIIFYTFGAQGINHAYKEISIIKKTSPSGGSLHPTEAYILIKNVEGIEKGFYHYDVETNSLIFIKGYSEEDLKNKIYEFTAGQEYACDANFLVFLSTRFHRNYWKYMKHTAAYQVTIRDASHLSQNFYLLGSFLNLGVFTAAINHINIEKELNLNPYQEGITLMLGCGVEKRLDKVTSLMPVFNKLI